MWYSWRFEWCSKGSSCTQYVYFFSYWVGIIMSKSNAFWSLSSVLWIDGLALRLIVQIQWFWTHYTLPPKSGALYCRDDSDGEIFAGSNYLNDDTLDKPSCILNSFESYQAVVSQDHHVSTPLPHLLAFTTPIGLEQSKEWHTHSTLVHWHCTILWRLYKWLLSYHHIKTQ
jgi:hypothetical protein